MLRRAQTAWDDGDRGLFPRSVLLYTHFRSMLKRVLNFELSSDFSDVYASGLEIVVVVSVADAVGVVGKGAGDALTLYVEISPEDVVVIVEGLKEGNLGGGSTRGAR